MANNFLDFTIRIKDEGSDTFKRIGVSAEDLNKGIRAVKEETDRLNSKIVNAEQLGQVFDAVQQSVMQLQRYCKDLTDTYQVQLVAETQLQTVMRQRMSATEEEIQSIKRLCSAQQQLGVIGDEVQLSGARQMATFLNEKASLDSLVPAMNNLLAQQKGLNATNQDAVSIGNMMGKAMQGQVDVLQRVGVTFTEAQKKVLQYGSESERAAMLAQVIRDNVGEMNAELARTDAGKQKQLENTLGDIKEQFGAMVQPAMQVLTALSQFVIVTTGVTKCYAAVRSLNMVFASTVSVTRIARASMLSLNATLIAGKAAFTGAAVGATTLKLAIRGLMISTGVGAAIAVLAFAIEKLLNTAYSISPSIDRLSASERFLKESTEAYTTAVSQAKAGIDMEISSLAHLIRSHGDESGKVQELNRKYGEALGYHKSAAEWYDVLIRKSADYCRAIGYEAQAKVIASQKAGKEMQLEAIRKQKQALMDSGGDKQVKSVMISSTDTDGNTVFKPEKREVESEAFQELRRQEARLVIENHNLGKSFEECMRKAAEGAAALNAGSKQTDVAAMSYEQLGKEIESTEAGLKGLAPTETAEIGRLTAYNKLLKERKAALGKQLGLGDGGGKGTPGETDIRIAPGSLAALEQQLSRLKEQQKNAPIEQQLIFTQDIVQLENLIAGIKSRLEREKFEIAYSLKPTVPDAPSASPIVAAGKSSLGKGGALEGFKIDTPELNLEQPLSGIESWNRALDTACRKNAETIGSLGAMGSAMGSLGQTIDGQAGAWLDWAGNLLGAIAQALPQLAALATANTATAATGAASSVAGIPFVGPFMAVAAVASVLAALAGLPKFADGGIAYGPTLGLFGEYAGAAHNPEVVAPLNRLRSLIAPASGIGGEVEFRIAGRKLVGILSKENNMIKRS